MCLRGTYLAGAQSSCRRCIYATAGASSAVPRRRRTSRRRQGPSLRPDRCSWLKNDNSRLLSPPRTHYLLEQAMAVWPHIVLRLLLVRRARGVSRGEVDALIRSLRSSSAIGRAIGTRLGGFLSLGSCGPSFLPTAGTGNAIGMIKLPIAAFVALMLVLYVYFIWQTQVWSGFDANYPDVLQVFGRSRRSGQDRSCRQQMDSRLPRMPPKACQTSAIVDVTADLTDASTSTRMPGSLRCCSSSSDSSA